MEPQPAVGSAVFSSRPWDDRGDGDPGYPRRSTAWRCASTCARAATDAAPSSRSTDGRYAVTGPTLALGGARQMQAYARRRLTRETDDTSRAWWQEVIGALAR